MYVCMREIWNRPNRRQLHERKVKKKTNANNFIFVSVPNKSPGEVSKFCTETMIGNLWKILFDLQILASCEKRLSPVNYLMS